MSLISNVRTGTISITAASGATVDTTISSVDTARCSIHLFGNGGEVTNNRILRHIFKASLTSSTNLRLVRNTASFATSITLTYFVIEWASGVLLSHQTGTFNASADPTDVTISSVTPGNCVPIFSFMTDQNALEPGGMCTAEVSSATNLRFDFGTTPGANDFDGNWTLLEFDPAYVTIQTGEISMASGAMSGTASISAVDLSRSIVLQGGTRRSVTGGTSPLMCRVHLSSSTQVTATRNNSGTDTNGLVVRYYVLTFTGMATTTGNASITDGNSSVNPTFTELPAGLYALLNCHPIGNSYYGSTNSGAEGRLLVNQQVSSPPDDIVLTRSTTGGDLHINYAILHQAVAAADDGALLLMLHHESGA